VFGIISSSREINRGMSFGVGIGDICLILDGIITICQRAGETKQILQAAQRDVQILRSTVLLLRDEIGNERLFVKNGSTEYDARKNMYLPRLNPVEQSIYNTQQLDTAEG
jgi:hypothetical protein